MTLSERVEVVPGSGDDPVYVEALAWVSDEGSQLSCVALLVDQDDDIIDFTEARARALGEQLIAAADRLKHALACEVAR